MTHSFPVRIYYEDTDAAGLVYHSNYLNFAERARTEWLRGHGFHQSDLLKDDGIGFVVSHISIDFLSPARLDDMLSVETHLHENSKVRMKMQQKILRAGTELARLSVELACIGKNGRPAKIPDALLNILKGHPSHG